MRPEKGTYLAYRQRYPLLGLLPRKHADFGLWREHRGLHRDGVWMRRNIIRQDQYRRLAVADEIARDGEDEIGIGAIHFGQEFIDRLHRDVASSRGQLRTPVLHVSFVEKVAHFRARAAGLRQHGRDDTIGCPAQQVPDHRAADAESENEELVDAEVIHQAKVIVGVCVPCRSTSSGPEDCPPLALRRSEAMQRYSALNSSIGL